MYIKKQAASKSSLRNDSLAADAVQNFTVFAHGLDKILFERHNRIPPKVRLVIDTLQIFAAAINSQLNVLSVVDHCNFLLNME